MTKRVRTGCLTCRLRHYKCDEVKPLCSRCRKSNRQCTWPVKHELVPFSHSSTTDLILHYLGQFHGYSYQMCAWTSLIELPRKSAIPSILQTDRPGKGYTNWANYFLPNLSTCTASDPLSLAICAFTALRMDDTRIGGYFYAKTLQLLRKILKERNAQTTSNKEFLRIWATTLVLAEFEAQLGHKAGEDQHIEGATTLSFIAASRFTEIERDVPRYERELPAYLAQYTQRLRHSSAITDSLHTVWPSFSRDHIEGNALGLLLEKSSECYALVMPLVERFYYTVPNLPPARIPEFMESLQPSAEAAFQSIAEYSHMLDALHGQNEVYSSCAVDPFPFSPIIIFVNPLMIQPTVIPHIFLMFLAPFRTAQQHAQSIRFISGVFAGFQYSKGLQLRSAFPDIYVASFWRRGPEREYFKHEMKRREGPFMVILRRIYETIDRQGMTHIEVLGVALREYTRGQLEGLELQHTRH